jgi:hypothetical protein
MSPKPRSTTPKRHRPATRSAVRSDDTNPSKPGNPPSKSSCPRHSPTRSTAPTPGFWPFTGSASPEDEKVGSANGPSQAAFNPRRTLRRRRLPLCSNTEAPGRMDRRRGSSSEEPAPIALHATSFADGNACPPLQHRGAGTDRPTSGSSSEELSP